MWSVCLQVGWPVWRSICAPVGPDGREGQGCGWNNMWVQTEASAVRHCPTHTVHRVGFGPSANTTVVSSGSLASLEHPAGGESCWQEALITWCLTATISGFLHGRKGSLVVLYSAISKCREGREDGARFRSCSAFMRLVLGALMWIIGALELLVYCTLSNLLALGPAWLHSGWWGGLILIQQRGMVPAAPPPLISAATLGYRWPSWLWQHRPSPPPHWGGGCLMTQGDIYSADLLARRTVMDITR